MSLGTKCLPEGIVHLGNESYPTCRAAKRVLQDGGLVSFVGIGRSMEPIIPDGTRCLLAPVTKATPLAVGDAVFCRVNRHFALHRIRAMKHDGKFLLIGGTDERYVDGWTIRKNVYGKYIGEL